MSGQTNRVTSGFTAIIDGKPTGLAGCSDANKCERAAYCIRSNPGLAYRTENLYEGKCYSFIAVHHQGATP